MLDPQTRGLYPALELLSYGLVCTAMHTSADANAAVAAD